MAGISDGDGAIGRGSGRSDGDVEKPRSPGHAFNDRLQDLVREAGFDAFVEGIAKRAADGRAVPSAGDQRDRELPSDRGDRIVDMSFGWDWRRLWVWDARIGETFSAGGGLRGESPLVRG
jgi:hypothetical protein